MDTTLLVDRRRLRLTLRRHGRVVMRARVGVGQSRWPTPKGDFYVRTRLVGYGLGSAYGPVALGYRPAPRSSPTGRAEASWASTAPTSRACCPAGVHGCVRLRNRDILRLDRLMPVGTPVTIR